MIQYTRFEVSVLVLNPCRGAGVCDPEGEPVTEEHSNTFGNGNKLLWLQDTTLVQVLEACYKLLVKGAVGEDLKSWMECIIRVLDAILFITSKEFLIVWNTEGF